MFRLRWLQHPVRLPGNIHHAGSYSSISTLKRSTQTKVDVASLRLAQLEDDNTRILRLVRTRLDERKNVLSKLSGSSFASEDLLLAKQLKETEKLQLVWDDWQQRREQLREALHLLDDPDPVMSTLAEEENNELFSTLTHIVTAVIPNLLIPPSPTGHMSALMEFKSGVGGSEASLFLSDLLRMYLRFASIMGWQAVTVSNNGTENGGVKDAIVEIKGGEAYDTLRWETGVHRVQRVPATEASGRVHTSTVAIVVLPLPEEQNPQDDELFSLSDVKVEVMRARGAGGQHVNKTESAVRLTHIPSGITVSMQDERSQHQNKRRAFQVLRARLMDAKISHEVAERRDVRRSLVQGADRSEKIRTYNFAQDRVTDHRIGLTLKNLTSVLEGQGLQDLNEALRKHYHENLLEDLLKD